MRNLGIASGAAAMAAIVASRFAAHGGGALAASAHGGATHPLAFALATRDAYLAMAMVAVGAAALSLRQADEPRGRTGGLKRQAGLRGPVTGILPAGRGHLLRNGTLVAPAWHFGRPRTRRRAFREGHFALGAP
jgi:hypothetical protein